MKTKTEKNFGFEYAEWMHNAEKLSETVDVDEMCNSSNDIPDGDYSAMVNAGIENPSARKYWMGYNEYMKTLVEN